MMYYKPTPLFRADVREIAHGLIIRTILYLPTVIFQTLLLILLQKIPQFSLS